jgi:flagella basal body P-ring formation protein FlgA
LIDRVKEQVAARVDARLQQLAGEERPWEVEVSVNGPGLRNLPPRWSDMEVAGLTEAVPGKHELLVHLVSEEGDIELPVGAKVERKVEVVVPVRRLPRGHVITSEDVEKRYVAGPLQLGELIRLEEEVVGRQTRLPLPQGRPIASNSVEKPVLVERRDEVEVVARRGAIVVREKVRALDDGGLGDTITVEKLDDSRTRFVVRVTGVQQAERCVSGALSGPIRQ